jgi:hypothetical protein
VVLEGGDVEPRALGQLRERDDALGIGGLRREKRAEDQFVSIVGHG